MALYGNDRKIQQFGSNRRSYSDGHGYRFDGGVHGYKQQQWRGNMPNAKRYDVSSGGGNIYDAELQSICHCDFSKRVYYRQLFVDDNKPYIDSGEVERLLVCRMR